MSPLFVTAENRGRYASGDSASGATVDSIDLHRLLESRKQIAHVWSLEDVQDIRPDLDDKQSWLVLQKVDWGKDASIGISWETLSMVAESLYPEFLD